MTTLLLYDEPDEHLAKEAATSLSEDGLDTLKELASVVTRDAVDAGSQYVLILRKDAGRHLSFWSGYVAGSGRVAIILSPDRSVPKAATAWPYISPLESSWRERLTECVHDAVGSRRPTRTWLREPNQLLHWIAEDAERLDCLSAIEYESLFAALLTRYDCVVEHKDDGTVLTDRVSRHRFLLQFKFAPANDQIGVTAVRGLASNVARYDCQFGLLVSNRAFSPAAQGLSRDSTPTIWLASKDWFLSGIHACMRNERLPYISGVANDVVDNPTYRWRELTDRLKASSVDSTEKPRLAVFLAGDDNSTLREVQRLILSKRRSVSCRQLRFEDDWNQSLREAVSSNEDVRVLLVGCSELPPRQSRIRFYATMSGMLRMKALRNRIAVIDESPAWAQLCVPPSLDAVFIEPSESSELLAWLAGATTRSVPDDRALVKRPSTAVAKRSPVD